MKLIHQLVGQLIGQFVFWLIGQFVCQQHISLKALPLLPPTPPTPFIHTEAIAASIAKLSTVNPVLGAIPPEPDASEKRLSRVQRTTLAQLGSGSCKLLNDFKMT